MTKNADLQSRNQIKDRKLAEAQQQLIENVRGRKCISLVLIPDSRRNSYTIMRNSYTIKRNSYTQARGRR